MSDAYDMIDRFLRNNLGSDDDYAEYSKALDSLCGAQPAQAGHVPEASCGECGKKASDGWALYCVACMEEAGLPAQAVPQWQPISTAPKDGTRVMVWMNDKYASNQHAFAKLWFYADGRLGGGAEGYSGDWSISHWMPLPPPPIVGKEGA